MDDNRILDKLDDIGDRMARVETTVEGLADRIDKYNNVTGRVRDLEHAVESMHDNCARIQAEKRRWRANPGAVIGSLLGGTIMLLIGYAVAQVL